MSDRSTGCLMLPPDPRMVHADLLEIARARHADGMMTAFRKPTMRLSRHPLGGTHADLFFQSETNGLDVFVPILDPFKPGPIDRKLSTIQEYLSEQGQARQLKLASKIEIAKNQTADSGIKVVGAGIVMTDGSVVNLVAEVLFLLARGCDTRFQPIRVDASAVDFRTSIDRIVKRHMDAQEVAHRLARDRQVGEVDEIADWTMRSNGFDLTKVDEGLNLVRRLDFKGADGNPNGHFKWQDFRICVAMDIPNTVSLDADIMTLANMEIPEALLGGMAGKQLDTVVEQSWAPGSTIIESASTNAGALEIRMRPRRLSFGANRRSRPVQDDWPT